jgi:glutaredoxin
MIILHFNIFIKSCEGYIYINVFYTNYQIYREGYKNMNKKIIGIICIALISVLPIAGASSVLYEYDAVEESFFLEPNFNHTVMVEYGSLTTCGPCVTASRQLYEIYTSGDLEYNYVTLVGDVGTYNANKRMQELGVHSVPDVYFDGGFKRILGAQTDETPYRTAIAQSGEREVADIDIDVEVDLKTAGILEITVTVYNNEPEEFNGRLITYIVEKESRWDDNSGVPYHYATLDIPIDSPVAISKSQTTRETHTFTKTWYGFLHGFSDITKDNIVVIAAVFDVDTGYAVESSSGAPATVSSKHFSQILPVLRFFNERLFAQFPLLQKLL